MRLLTGIIVAFVLIASTGFGFMIARPMYMQFSESFNSTVVSMNLGTLTSFWNTIDASVKYLFWILGSLIIVFVLGWLYSWVSGRDYVTGGGYF